MTPSQILHPLILTIFKEPSLKEVLVKLGNCQYLNSVKKQRYFGTYLDFGKLSKFLPTSEFKIVNGHLSVFALPLISYLSIKTIWDFNLLQYLKTFLSILRQL